VTSAALGALVCVCICPSSQSKSKARQSVHQMPVVLSHTEHEFLNAAFALLHGSDAAHRTTQLSCGQAITKTFISGAYLLQDK